MEQICAKCGRPIRDERQTCLESPKNNENSLKDQYENEKQSEKPLCRDCVTEIETRAYEIQLEM